MRRCPDWHRWGLSAFCAQSNSDVRDLGVGPPSGFVKLEVYRVADLEAAGFEVVPTFRTLDETGLPWTFLDEAADPSRIVPGAHVVAGSVAVRAVVVLVDVTAEGMVHVRAVPGSVATSRSVGARCDAELTAERVRTFAGRRSRLTRSSSCVVMTSWKVRRIFRPRSSVAVTRAGSAGVSRASTPATTATSTTSPVTSSSGSRSSASIDRQCWRRPGSSSFRPSGHPTRCCS